jgi:cytochrome c
MLILFLFIPYISVLFGGTVLSIYYRRRGLRESSTLFLQFARDIIETLTINKSIGVILGIVPPVIAVLIFAQLFHSAQVLSVEYLLVSSLITSVAIIMVYTYRYSVTFSGLFVSIKKLVPEDGNADKLIRNYREGSGSLSNRSGKYGITLLFIAMYFFVGAVSVAIYGLGSESFIAGLFSLKVIFRFVQFITIAFTITGGAIFFSYFHWDGGKKIEDEIYQAFIKKTALAITFAGALIQPVFITIDIIILPYTALSGSVFSYGILAIILIFISYHLLYSMIRNSDLKMSGPVFYILLFALFAIIVKDQLAMKNETKLNSVILAANYDKYLSGLNGGNVAAEKVSGEQIYKNICSSCHSFDHKVVGPPYKETLPKYEGKLNQLVAFIRNPVKKNPDYPSMPNPVLKPNEAQAIAEWIMKTYKTK